jgi:hypothetical protein
MGLFFHWMMLWDFVIQSILSSDDVMDFAIRSILSLDDDAMGLCKWVCSFIG